jgi:hypothetical protein
LNVAAPVATTHSHCVARVRHLRHFHAGIVPNGRRRCKRHAAVLTSKTIMSPFPFPDPLGYDVRIAGEPEALVLDLLRGLRAQNGRTQTRTEVRNQRPDCRTEGGRPLVASRRGIRPAGDTGLVRRRAEGDAERRATREQVEGFAVNCSNTIPASSATACRSAKSSRAFAGWRRTSTFVPTGAS